MRLIIVLLCLNVISCFSVNPKPICCFPNQFETFMFMSQGTVDIGSGNVGYGYGYANATIMTSFDGVNQLTYTHDHSQNFMSIWPIPIILDSIDILDYINNKQWRVYADGSCDKMDVGLPLYQECIPGNATLISEGLFGQSGQIMKTYMFYDRIYLDPYEVTATVMISADKEGECTPVRMSVSDSYVFDSNKNVDITVVDIFDFTEGIKDRSVFTPPSSCDKETKIKTSTSKRHSGRIRDILWNFANRHKRTETN